MIVTKSDFAKQVGIGKAGVTLSIQRGKIVQTTDGLIDTENEINSAYIKMRTAKNERPKKHKQNTYTKKLTEKLEPADTLDLPEPDVDIDYSDVDGTDALAKMAVDIRLKTAQAKRHELKYEQDKGLLVPLEAVERAASRVMTEMKIRLQDLPTRISPRIIALATSGADQIEVQSVLEREIDDAIESMRAALEAPIV